MSSANNTFDNFCREAAFVLSQVDWFEGKPITESDVAQVALSLREQCKDELDNNPRTYNTVASTRGIAVWAARSTEFTEHYYKYMVVMLSENPTEMRK